MNGDYALEDTVYLPFTTRAFATGIPTVLAGTPVVEIYEDASVTQITTAETLTVSIDAIVGFNMCSVAATAANGFEATKSYTAILSAGTVDSVSVVGEVIGQFTIQASAAAVDLANATDGLGAIKAETALIVADTNELQTDDVPGLIATLDGVVDTVKAETALIVADTNELQTDWANGGRLDTLLDAVALEATVGALNNVSTADINAQVADVLKTDTVSEMAQGAPTATPTMQEILNYLYREWIRNKVVVDTNTANQKQIFADDGTTILYEKDLTNASNVTTVAEATTGL